MRFMRSYIRGTAAVSTAVFVMAMCLALAACGTDANPAAGGNASSPTAAVQPLHIADTPTAIAVPSIVPSDTPPPVPVSTPTPVAEPEPASYDSNAAMYKVFGGFGRTSNRTYDALEEVRQAGDKSMVAVLVKSMRFQSSANARAAVASVLQDLTGQAYDGEDWKGWMEWLGKHRDEYPPPSEYLRWKLNLMRELDPRFVSFLSPALDGAIDVDPTEIVWGGVLPDGIPDIRNPQMLTPNEADFLDSDERVFGLDINGEARAYPLRIANAHEMVNDVVGGEHIALSW